MRWLRASPRRAALLGVLLLVAGLLAVGVHQLIQQQRAACAFWRDLGAYPVEEIRTDLGRRLITDARVAADRLDCP